MSSHIPDITLDKAKTGKDVHVTAIHGKGTSSSRLSGMGFLPGTFLSILQNNRIGPLIVYLRDTQVAIGRREAKNIRVKETI